MKYSYKELCARRAELEARFDAGEATEIIVFWLNELDRKILAILRK